MLVGRYRLLDLVGEGGMGVVWRAHDCTLGRDDAINFSGRSLLPTGSKAQVRAGGRILAGLANEHIVRVHDYVDDEVQPFW